MESPAERYPVPTALLHSSFKVPGVWTPPPNYRFPSVVKGPLWRERPVSGAFLNISSRVPIKGAPPPRPPPRSLFRERCSIPTAPFIHLSKSPLDEPSSRFPKRSPYGKRCPSPEPFLHILQGPQQWSPPSSFPSQSSHRERRSTFRAPFDPISKSLVDEHTPGCPTEPPRRQMPVPIDLYSFRKLFYRRSYQLGTKKITSKELISSVLAGTEWMNTNLLTLRNWKY